MGFERQSIALPGRDFQFPAKVGDMSPQEMTNFIRWAIANDPTILPSTLRVKDIVVDGDSYTTTINSLGTLPTGPGFVWVDSTGTGSAAFGIGMGVDEDIALARAFGSPLVAETFPRIRKGNNAAPTAANLNGRLTGGLVYIPETITVDRMVNWTATAATWGAATSRVNVGGIYGPLTVANKAAVPLLVSGTSADSWFTGNGIGGNPFSLTSATTLVGGSIYGLVMLSSWAGTPTLNPAPLFFTPASNSNNTRPGQEGSASIALPALYIEIASQTSLPATIDWTNNTVPSAPTALMGIPWLGLLKQ